MALGAGRGEVLALVLREALGVTAVGLAFGLLGAFASTRMLSALLYEVAPTDPATFAGVAALLAVVALAACAVPARRATKVEPLVALRRE